METRAAVISGGATSGPSPPDDHYSDSYPWRVPQARCIRSECPSLNVVSNNQLTTVHTVWPKRNRCAFDNHDSCGITETCTELGSVFSISHELCLVMANTLPFRLNYLCTRPYGRGSFSGAKAIWSGHETRPRDCTQPVPSTKKTQQATQYANRPESYQTESHTSFAIPRTAPQARSPLQTSSAPQFSFHSRAPLHFSCSRKNAVKTTSSFGV